MLLSFFQLFNIFAKTVLPSGFSLSTCQPLLRIDAEQETFR
jgi:hypothetical protein